MKNVFRIVAISVILLSACESGEKKLFWVSEPNGQENDFLFMAESTNVPEIQADSLLYYLTKEEITSAEQWTFKNFGKIHADKEFSVYVLLKEGSKPGRDYTFILRTFNNHFKIVDTYELASWVDAENHYCFGSIDEHLIIKRSCEKEKDVKQMINDGRMVASSLHGRD